jgi:uncharacterized membrane-anchored protein
MFDRLTATYSTSYIISIVFSVIIAGGVIRQCYHLLGRYLGWQSPWKRLLCVSPAIVIWVVVVVSFLEP